MNQQEIEFVACLLAVGPPPVPVAMAQRYGLTSQSTYKTECRNWFERSKVARVFHINERVNSCGSGWWIDYKRWLWENQNEQTTA